MVTERFRYLPAHLYYFLKPSRLLSVTDKLGGELTRFLLSAALIFIGFSIFSVPLPAYFRTVVGLDEGVIYLLFIANALSSTLLYRPAARFTRKQGPLKILPASLASRIILFPLIVAPFGLMQNSSSQLLAVAIIFVAVGSTWAFINVSNLVIVSRLSEGRFKGQAFGLYNAIIGASFVFGSLVGGYFAEYSSYLATFLLASLFMAVGLTIIRKIPFGKVSPKEEA